MTLSEIVAQLKLCGYRCEAGSLEMNVAFQELEKMANGGIEFGVVLRHDTTSFAEEIQDMLNNGWRTHGAIVVPDTPIRTLVQAMIRP